MAEAPGLDLQIWLVAVLTADAGVAAIAGDRIYDTVPSDGVDGTGAPVVSPALFPYVRIGPVALIWHRGGGCDMAEADVTINAFSRAGGKQQAHELAHACEQAVLAANAAGLPVRTWGGAVRLGDARIFADPDGITTDVAMIARALLTRAA